MRHSALGAAVIGIAMLPGVARAQANEWKWVAGPNIIPPQTLSQPATYGPEGVFGPNYIPQGQTGATTWVDKSGNFWLFGGISLWQFNPTIRQWAWMGGGGGQNCPSLCTGNGVYGTKGVAEVGVYPGARSGSASWTDSQGRFWLFGGEGYDYTPTNLGPLNDLWMLDPSTGLWAWMGGNVQWAAAVYGTKGQPNSANIPGARFNALSWTDKNGNFWLYGGQGLDANAASNSDLSYLNDLWMFNPNTMQWTWVWGDSTGTEAPTYPVSGTQGLAASTNSPGSRFLSQTWTDQNGNLWLFSGGGANDLWEYNPSAGMWTWVTGTTCVTAGSYTTCGGDANYGTLGQPGAQTTPGVLQFGTTWTDKNGNLWLFGGGPSEGEVGSNSATMVRGDTWVFNVTSRQWAWMGGNIATCNFNNICTNSPAYGSLGVAAAGSNPGGRGGAAGWVDQGGNLWLFGGNIGFELNSSAFGPVALNDVWEFSPSTTSLPPAETPHLDPAPGQYPQPQSVTISSRMPNATFYFTTDGSTPTANSTPYTGPFLLENSETVNAIALAPGYPNSGVGSASYALQALPPVLSPPQGIYSSAQTVTISDATPGAAVYYTTDGTTPTGSSAKYSGPITVSTSETITAIASAPSFANSPTAGATYTISVPQFALGASPGSLLLAPGGQATVTITLSPSNGFNSPTSFVCSGLPAGVTCSFSPATVTPSGGANATTTVTIAASASAAARHGSRPWLPAGALSLAGLLLWWRPRRKAGVWLAVLVAAIGLSMMSACGGGGASGGGSTGGGGSGGGPSPTPTTSTITITGTSGSLQASTTLTLTLN